MLIDPLCYSSRLMDLQFREACPPHKLRDLDSLVRQCKGDEAKIQAQIMQWWEEPQVVEEEWVSAGKANKKTETKGREDKSGGGASGSDKKKHDPRPIIAPPRRRDGRGMRDRGGRGGRFDRDRGSRPSPTNDRAPAAAATAAPAAPPQPKPSGGPAPVTNVPTPKGAWGQPRPPPAAAPAPEPEVAAVTSSPAPPPAPEQPEEVNVLSNNDPTPSGLPPKSSAPAGNVWATRGSAHLIQAEKAKPPPPVPEPAAVEEPELYQQQMEEPAQEAVAEQPTEIPMPSVQPELANFMSVDSVLPPSVNGANINASGWEPLEINESMSPTSEGLVMEAPPLEVKEVVQPVLEVPETTLPPPSSAMPPPETKQNVLNMGHWDGDDQDDDELDFGFGGFGNDNNNAKEEAPSAQELPATTASPARPPPGLSMPPMPAGAILVHELENKLENTSLNQPALTTEEPVENKNVAAPSSSSQPQSFGEPNNTAGNYPMNQYGGYGMGMYNMNTSNGGFGSMPPGQFPLGGPLGQQQPKQQGLAAPNQNQRAGTSPTLQQGTGAPYTQNESTNAQQLPTTGGANQPPNMPPGVNQIPAGMQGYPNPAFMYGQYNQMGHPYPGMQYGYAGQGQQFGVQGGFGYHQVMSGGGYGAPYGHDGRHHGDDNHSHMRDNHHNYPKGGGGYRHNNRNNHQGGHNNYGNNYQGGSYGGGGPYGNNYQGQYGDQFQRGGYGGNNDHYGMQGSAPYPGGGYQNDNDGKGKSKGPRVQQGFHQQPVGLQATQNESGTGGGWPSSGPTGQSWGGNWQQDN